MLVTREPGSSLDQIAHAVIGAAIEVHRHLGPGFTEEVYEKALCIELGLRGIPFGASGRSPSTTRATTSVPGDSISWSTAAWCWSSSPSRRSPKVDVAKVLSYLKASGCELALLINFNVPLLRDGIRRLVRSLP